jgi:RNAse (barnase) inhibitor barstar
MYFSYPFEFNVQAELATPAMIHLHVSPSISSRRELFDTYANQFCFPDYFGENWDAFIDCMSDLSWIDADEIMVVHEGLPSLPDKDLCLYLESLQDVLGRARSTDRPRARFLFRESDRARIDELLGASH